MSFLERLPGYLALPPHELRARTLGTIGLIQSLMSKYPSAAAAKANSMLRVMLHDAPLRGRHIYKGRRKLAANLRSIPDLPQTGTIAVNFKSATTHRIQK